MAKRLAGRYGYPADKPFAVTLHPERLEEPLHWKKPRRIFVNSMSDLFHKNVPDEFIDKVFAVMTQARQHTFQILTKRPERMLTWFQRPPLLQTLSEIAARHNGGRMDGLWPLPNVWLGVSAEDQPTFDQRVAILSRVPAAVRFVSLEPLLGPINAAETFGLYEFDEGKWALKVGARWAGSPDWVIVGGESGPGARPMNPDWARQIRDACKAAGVPFLFKQWGEWTPAPEPVEDGNRTTISIDPARDRWMHKNGTLAEQPPRAWWPAEWAVMRRVGKRAAGRLLDGELWDQYPEVRM